MAHQGNPYFSTGEKRKEPVFLTIYPNNIKGRGKKQTRSFTSIEEAVRFGQETGLFYDIFDTVTGRNIDWCEVNEPIDDGWYYDEAELVWKKYRIEDSFS